MMKKTILCCILLISARCFAQDTPKSFLGDIASRLSFGLRGGVNYSNFTSASFGTNPLVGFNAGISVNLKMSDHWSAVEDVIYSTEGSKRTTSLFGNSDIKLSYINVPILFRYKTDPGIFFELGEQAGIKVREDVAGLTNGDFAKKLNFGAVGGVGYQLTSGLGVSLRYIYGLTKVGDTNNLPVSGNFKSATAQASLFYTF
jgi:hypothetical protein